MSCDHLARHAQPAHSALADAVAVAAVAAGDEAAFAFLYDRYARPVFSLALRMTRDQGAAEDITQEVFLRVWRHADSFTADRGRVANWLLSLTHHLAIDHWRRQRARPPAAAGTDDVRVHDIPDPRVDVVEAAWVRVQRDLLLSILAQLPVTQRQVIELAYYGGLTQAEIAARLDVPLGTVKTRLRLGLLRLRHLAREEELGPPPP